MSYQLRIIKGSILTLLNLILCCSALLTSVHASSFFIPHLTYERKALERDSTSWGVYHDMGYIEGRLDRVKQGNFSNPALKLSLLGGQPFTGIQIYHDLPAQNKATTFALDVTFQFPQRKGIQALEFGMDKWTKNTRWEWALQWEAIADATSRQGNPPTWRVWDGKNWQDTGIRQDLQTTTWHHLRFYGNVLNGQVHYLGLICDQLSSPIMNKSFAPVASPGEKLAVSMQLDGDRYNTPYTTSFETIGLSWQ